MNTRNIIAFVLTIVALICLYPGLTMNILTIYVGGDIPIIGHMELFTATRSIMGTIQNLHENNNDLVAFLILFFSVIIPIFKGLSLLAILALKQWKGRTKLHKFLSIIGKWSMADVFVVGIFLAYLATDSNDNIQAWLHNGFYYFLAYCIISLLATQIMDLGEIENHPVDDTISYT